MSTSPASFLRLHLEPPPDVDRPLPATLSGLANLCRAFECATGWQLTCEPQPQMNFEPDQVWATPLAAGAGDAGQLCLRRKAGEAAAIDTANASRLAAAISELISSRLAAETALWQREAELASCVPVVSRPDEADHLAERLESVLKTGAESIGCHAAGLYLLDADTTQLKLRSVWGLARTRLLQPPRLLATAMADLEALAGHAVVLEKAALAEVWSLPEHFPAAVCVPVSTPTVPLGTLWVYSQSERPFSDAEVNLAELIAGRLAAELEREMLLAEGQESIQVKRQMDRAGELQSSSARRPAPLVDGWEIAGWANQSQQVGGAHFDWHVGEHDKMLCALGDAVGGGVAAALVTQTVRAAVSSHVEHSLAIEELLRRTNQTLWRSFSGDQVAALCLAELTPASGRVRCTWAGSPAVVHIHKQTYELLREPACPLGLEPDSAWNIREINLLSGEVLVLCSPALAGILQQPGHRLNAATLAMLLMDHLDASANNLSDLIRSCCDSQALDLDLSDRSVMVIKRV